MIVKKKITDKPRTGNSLGRVRPVYRPEEYDPQIILQLQAKNSRSLPVVAQMRALFNQPDSPFRSSIDLKYTICAKGTVIFTLPSGGTVRDTGTVRRRPGQNSEPGS